MFYQHFASPPTQYGHGQQPFYAGIFGSPALDQPWAMAFPTLNGSANGQPPSPSRLQPGGQQQPHHPATTIDPSLMLQTYPVQPQLVLSQQQQQQLQHYPVSVNPSLLQAQQPPPGPKPTLAEALKPLLASKTLETGSRAAVNGIVNMIDQYGGPADVDLAVRLELMSRIRDNAGADFLMAWVNNPGAREIVKIWLKSFVYGKDAGTDENNNACIALLYVIQRLPFTVANLLDWKIGRLVKQLQREPPTNGESDIIEITVTESLVLGRARACPSFRAVPSRMRRKDLYLTIIPFPFSVPAIESCPAIKSVSVEIEKNWMTIVRSAEGSSANANSPAESVDKEPEDTQLAGAGRKRKLTATGASRDAPTAKKAATAVASNGKVVKKENKAGSSSSSGAKSDSSFFSAPKAKPKLPSFKKAPAATVVTAAGVKQQETNVAQPMSIDPFQEAMKSLNKNRFGSPAQSATPPNTAAVSGSVTEPNVKPKKRVHFPPDHELVKTKMIERAVYEDDPADNGHGAHNVRDYDRAEGAAMHQSLFQELIDWFEPQPLVVPQTTFDGQPFPYTERGRDTQEKGVQEAREQKSLQAMYLGPEDIPPSPAEPPAMPEVASEEPREMLLGAELEALMAPPPESEPEIVLPQASAKDLVSQLASTMTATATPPPVVPAIPQLLSIPTDMEHMEFQRLLALATNAAQHAQPPALPQPTSLPPPTGFPPAAPSYGNPWEQPAPAQPQPSAYGSGSAWGDYGQEERKQWGGEGSGGGWRGGDRGRGRGGGRGAWRGKKKLCNFFAAGK
ncbi:hypothetical protein EXIGLDRAFT_846775 [Exidia glandulosa HHB12029]|uniref:TFIIS N-terminal domain-containing protein n=1 Tax=Exidia glandulosa HHB12029 TaxID=1314781 RepID=A0A165Z484_EXIGL|nr:hypothetical protein EXIGLDRAFT_846775 [Exidia glandulosa HHB12029]